MPRHTASRRSELCIGITAAPLPSTPLEAGCRAIKEEAAKHGVRLASIASKVYWDRALGDSNQAARALALREDLEKMIRISSWLGGKNAAYHSRHRRLLLHAGSAYRSGNVSVLLHATEEMRAVLTLAEKAQVRLGIENVWSKFLLSPAEMAGFIDSFNSPWVGAYVDVANMLLYGYPEQWLRHSSETEWSACTSRTSGERSGQPKASSTCLKAT